MKPSVLACLVVVMGCIVSSCSHTITCEKNYTIKYLLIPYQDTAVTYSLKIIGYDRGRNFAKAIDSMEVEVQGTYALVANVYRDYRIIVLPANRVHTITNICAGDEKRKGSPGLSSEQCVTSLTFLLDGKVMTIPFGLAMYGSYLIIEI